MRLYTFTNYYLSSIQQGIQPAHVVGDLLVKYLDGGTPASRTAFDWAMNHKTMICLNGGNAEGIRSIYHTLEQICPALNLPFVKFHEDNQSLDSTMTSCGVVVPAYLYEAPSNPDSELVIPNAVSAEIELIALMRSCRLAS